MMTTGRAPVDPDVVARQNELVDLYNGWGDDPDDDPEFVDQAREIMGLPPFEDEVDFPALRSEPAGDDEVVRALVDAFTNVDRARYGTGVGERISAGREGGGRFRKLTDRLTDALEDWVKGEGPDDPLDEFNREQLRKTAVELAGKARAAGDNDRAARLTPRRGASSDEIKLALYKDIRASRRGERDVPGDDKPSPTKKAAPKPSDLEAPKLSDDPDVRAVQVENRIREAYVTHKLAGGYAPLANVRAELSDLSREEQDAALRALAETSGVHIIPWDNRKALTAEDHAASLRIGGDESHVIRFEDPSPRPLPGHKKVTPAKKAAPKASDVDPSTLDDPEALRDALDLHKVPELKDMLRDAGLPVSGRKRELVDRLVEHRTKKADTPAAEPNSPLTDEEILAEAQAELARLTDTRGLTGREAADASMLANRERARIAGAQARIEAARPRPTDLMEEHRWRAAHGDVKRDVAGTLSMLDELTSNGASAEAVQHRLRSAGRGLRPEVVADLTEAGITRDPVKVAAAIDRVAAAYGLTRVGVPAGGVEPLNVQTHEMLGNLPAPPTGTFVRVVRPGYYADLDGQRVVLTKSVVDVASPEEIAAVKAAVTGQPNPDVADEFTPRPSAPATPVRRSLRDAETTKDVGFEARIEARRITGRHIDFNFDGADAETAREHAEGILRGLEHVPSTPLLRVGTFGPGGTIDDHLVEGLENADAVTLQRADPRGPIIAFNTRKSGPGAVDHYHDHIADRGYSGWSVPGAQDGIYVGVHELGHAATSDKLAEKILDYADKAAGVRGFEYTDDLIAEDISQYASTNSQELAAEAFAAVVLNGDMASPTAKRIYDMIIGRRRS